MRLLMLFFVIVSIYGHIPTAITPVIHRISIGLFIVMTLIMFTIRHLPMVYLGLLSIRLLVLVVMLFDL